MKPQIHFLLPLLAVLAIVSPRMAAASDCTVTNSDDNGDGSLRNCILNVATTDGDVITIDPSVTNPIGLTSGDLDINVSLSIQGAGPTTSIIDGSGNGGSRMITIDATPSGKTVTISGVTLQGASFVGGGAALFLDANNLTLSDCVVKNNATTGGMGGAILAVGGSLTIDNCAFTDNHVDDGSDGGAIANDGSTLSIDGSTFSGNFTEPTQGGLGGALYLTFGSAQIQNTDFLDNTADGGGGAIYHVDTADLTVTNCTFDGNSTANDRGGAIFNSEGQLNLSNSDFLNNKALLGAAGAVQLDDEGLIENCYFEGNTAVNDDGGAIHNDAPMTLRNSTFVNNSVSEADGGAIFLDNPATIENCTFTGNFTAGTGLDDEGGGIAAVFGTHEILNSTIFGNTAEHDGGGLFVGSLATTTINNVTIAGNTANNQGGGVATSGTLTFSNSIIAGNTGGGGTDCVTTGTMTAAGPSLIQTQTGCTFGGDVAEVLSGDPGLAADLADNGGPGLGRDAARPTLTLALLNDSIALEAGDNATCLATDQRGVTRPQGPICDLGSFESGPTADLSSLAVNFGDQQIGTTSGVQSVTLTNNGPVELVINDIALGGTNAGDFTETDDCAGALAPGATCNMDTTFTPSEEGARSAEITVDTILGVQIIALTGNGITSDGDGGCGLHSEGTTASRTSILWMILMSVGGLAVARKKMG
jgi:predicted outer membrane repeat protein